MRSIFLIFVLFILQASAQSESAILATAAGKNFTPASLSARGQELYFKQKALIEAYRSELLSKMVADTLVEMEAASLSVTPESLISSIESKITAPSATEIQIVYEANRAQLGNRSLDHARSDIVSYLKRRAADKAVSEWMNLLRNKYRVRAVKEVNTAGLGPTETLMTLGTRLITVGEFETKNAAALNDRQFRIHRDLLAELEAAVLTVLVAEEAGRRGVDTSAVIAKEITDKLRDFTEQEKHDLETALQTRLFTKYAAKILLPSPRPHVQNISVDDDPAVGPANAPVTVVMFSDFQCSSCASVHPVLKSVIAEFPGKVRFVVRDFPLVTIHEHAFASAVAANAAKNQGKFFAYIEVLYANQSVLDPASLRKHAAGLGLNLKQFEIDSKDPNNAAEVRKDMAEGALYGVAWTPSIYINGAKLQGFRAEDMREAIANALKK